MGECEEGLRHGIGRDSTFHAAIAGSGGSGNRGGGEDVERVVGDGRLDGGSEGARGNAKAATAERWTSSEPDADPGLRTAKRKRWR